MAPAGGVKRYVNWVPGVQGVGIRVRGGEGVGPQEVRGSRGRSRVSQGVKG